MLKDLISPVNTLQDLAKCIYNIDHQCIAKHFKSTLTGINVISRTSRMPIMEIVLVSSMSFEPYILLYPMPMKASLAGHRKKGP